jgi:hypothetical protein
MKRKNGILFIVFMGMLFSTPAPGQESPGKTCETLAKFPAPEAHQGVAVDAEHFYAVTDRAIGKYEKKTGKRVDKWEGSKDGPVIHLDSGVVVDGKLYAAHSNYPGLPMTSSVEIWDVKTMKHAGSHSFGILWGSLTWLDRHEGSWWAVFANYSRVFGPSQQPYGNTHWTTLVKFDDTWQWKEAWIFPEKVLNKSEPMSISGGSWGPDGLLYCTGHDHPELYALRLPRAGSVLDLVEVIPIDNQGQGIAWDRSDPGTIYSIHRAQKQVVVSKLRKK